MTEDTKKPARKKPARKKPARKKPAASTKTVDIEGARPILPGDENFTAIESGRGRRPNHAAMALDEMIREAVDKGYSVFQLRNNEPFTVTQLRYWAKQRNTFPDDLITDLVSSLDGDLNHIQISGSTTSEILQVSLVHRNKE